MSPLQIGHSKDIVRLRNEGYEVEIKGGCLCIHHIPYVNTNKEVKLGTIISEINIVGTDLGQPAHTVHFMGEEPCDKNGTPLSAIINSTVNKQFDDGLIGNYYFSSKPEGTGVYNNYYDKITRYVDLLSVHARKITPGVTAKTYTPYRDDDSEVFHYFDSNSSRSGISSLNAVFKGQKVAIIGLGGTGSYILDFVAKTQVAEIHLFDDDVFSQHNAFRAPGAPSFDILAQKPKKAEYFAAVYGNMHKHIYPHLEKITESNVGQLASYSYIFICVDKNSVRHLIVNTLSTLNIPFVDVGLGVNIQDGRLTGIIRTTAGTADKNDHLVKRIFPDDPEDNEYTTNIQIADLNAINACLAVEKWKKYSGFYQDDSRSLHSTYTFNASLLLNADPRP